jgi:uncharacterized protein (TIGR02246 family)
MKVLNSILIIMLAWATNGCAEPVDLEAEAAAIRQLTDVNWLEAGKTRDLDRWMSHYTEDTIFFPPGGAPVVGKKAMRKLISEFLDNPDNAATWETTAVEVSLSGDMAYSYGPQQNTRIDEQANTVTDNLKWSIVWEKQADGSWKCAFMTMDFDDSIETAPPAGQPEQGIEGSAAYQADVQAIRTAEIEAVRAFNEGDIDSYMAAYPEDSAWLPPNSPIVEGADAIRAQASQLAANPGFAFDVQVATVEVSRDGGLAYLIGSYQLTLSDPKGNPGTDHGKFVEVWKKHPDSSWNHVLAIWNSNDP